MLTCLLTCAVLAMRWYPETPVARWFGALLDATGAALRRIERRHLIFVILMAVILTVGAEFLAMAGPLDVGLVVMWDVSALVDALLAAGTLAVVARTRSGWRFVLHRLLPRSRQRTRARRGARPIRRASNDDDRPAVPLAA